MEQPTKVKPNSMLFEELMLKVRTSKMLIPDFQREFVWDRSQIISLLDSIYQHYPIGSFLLWQTDDVIQAYRRIGDVELQTGPEKSVQYVLDGQQRITSLFASLEQAVITHRVNGKKVTKKLELYFDLDKEEFVAEPFAKDNKAKRYRFEGLNQITTTTDILAFILRLLSIIARESLDQEMIIKWISDDLGVSVRRARHYHLRLSEMGLYSSRHDEYILTEAGKEVLETSQVGPILQGFISAINYVEQMLIRLVDQGECTEDELAEYIENEMGGEKVRWKVRCRLKWLAGLGLGKSKGRRFILSNEGRAVVENALKTIEIQARDRQDLEEDKKKRFFSIRQITDMSKFVQTATKLDEQRQAALSKVLQRLTSYPFSIIDVFDQPIEVACDIFERINTSGNVLNVVDLMVAKTWSKSFNLRDRLATFREELKRENYDALPEITILQCASVVIQKSVQRKEILGIEKGSLKEQWEGVLESIRQAIDFLKSNLHVTHAKVLPYNSIVVPLTYFFHISKSKQHTDRVRNVLEQWFWKVSVGNRYDSSVETKIGDDIAEMEKLAHGEAPNFNYVSPLLSSERIAEQKLNLGSAFCKTILCILNNRMPKEFKDSSPVSLTSFSKFNAVELHHIFPQDYLKKHDKEHYPERDGMANIALARASANKAYWNKAPSSYLPGCKNPQLNEVLKSHFIEDKDASGLLEDDFEGFVQYRADRILDEMRRLTGHMAEVEADFKGNEARAIEKFELQMRELLDSVLRGTGLDYWQNTGSPEFRMGIEERIKGLLKSNPSKKREDLREVDFCQILEYLKVAKGHWSVFESIFKSKSDLEVHLKNVSNFRNALMHNREIDLSTRQLALGSLSWFDEVFKAAKEMH